MKLNANITGVALAVVMSVAVIPAQAKSAGEWQQVAAAVAVLQEVLRRGVAAPGDFCVVGGHVFMGKKCLKRPSIKR